jgi:enoyl-CoA hydratase/carnithine racemase
MNVTLELNSGVARVTISRPEVLNALDAAAQQELEDIWQRIERDPDVRVVVLTGAGERAFCSGADIKAAGSSGLDYWAHPLPKGFGGLPLRDTLNVPVIARVNGYALGGGLELMLGCDIAVACYEATFALPEPKVGRMPLDGGMTRSRWDSSTRSCRAWISMWRSSAGSAKYCPVRRCRCAR